MSQVLEEQTILFRQEPAFKRWAEGFGVIRHDDFTQLQMHELAESLWHREYVGRLDHVFRVLAAADRVACATMWLVAHMTYARHVFLDGRELGAEDFKPRPEGHTGGSLNMAIAYVGYLAANTLTGTTRSWLMGQGHCVAAIDAANLILGNMTSAHSERYGKSEAGYSRFVQDFYSYRITPTGAPESPLGSHVNQHTAGGMQEGGYLGFAELSYPHMPLPGESLVAFLSDGAFEEQRGGDWAPRWWRAEDSGLIVPILIANGRRIDQRTTVIQQGGVDWLRQHLKLNGFEPLDIDGEDPAAYVWAILRSEDRLAAHSREISSGRTRYPALIPYTIAEVPKGFGLPNAGTNAAHNLPLGGDLVNDPEARRLFNESVRRLHVPPDELEEAVRILNNHQESKRPRERNHALAQRCFGPINLPEPVWKSPTDKAISPMDGLDRYFCEILRANPDLRARVGNPDEIRSNRLDNTLDMLKHRVAAPEPGIPESVHGAVITALNEEAVVCAALANKGGINLVCTYEAFGVKMLGPIRQELTFSRRQRISAQRPGWISVPVVLTSHTWENGKNELSHQDTTLCEVLMGEMSDVSRVVFTADWNTTVTALRAVYQSRGEIWTLVVPKQPFRHLLTPDQARTAVDQGLVRLRGDSASGVILAAVGAYQLEEAFRASDRLNERGVPHSVIYVFEPGRLRQPRDGQEQAVLVPRSLVDDLFPQEAKVRIFLVHCRPEPLQGLLSGLVLLPETTRFLGFRNQGGTLNEADMLFANGCTWAHAVAAVEEFVRPSVVLLNESERAAIEGRSEHPLRDLALKDKDPSPAGQF